MVKAKYTDPLQAIYDNIVIDDNGCWNWQRTKDSHGYGRTYVYGHNMPTHRASLLLHGQDLINGLDVDHLCRNKSCCNPEHLEQVTRQVNIQRSFLNDYRKLPLIQFCLRGHEFTPENTRTYMKRSGTLRRKCVKCIRILSKRRRIAGYEGQRPTPRSVKHS